MKKTKFIAAAVLTLPLALSACGPKPNPKDSEMPVPPVGRIAGAQSEIKERKSPYDISGSYSVEYVHYPRGEEKDDTLAYSLTLSGDNTYVMSVVTDGVNAEHYGRWYVTGGSVLLFFDEPLLSDTPHHVFVGDSMYLELVAGGKLMVFENGKTIVLSREINDDVMIAPSRS